MAQAAVSKPATQQNYLFINRLKMMTEICSFLFSALLLEKCVFCLFYMFILCCLKARIEVRVKCIIFRLFVLHTRGKNFIVIKI